MIEFIQWDNRSWEKQATTSIFLLHLAFKSQGFVGFQCMCQSMNSGINLFVPWSAASLSFYKGQSRSRGWCPVFSVHREDEDCVFEQNGALGATALKKGSCEPMFVVSASCLASAIAGLIWEIIKSPLNPFFFFWVGTCFIFTDGVPYLISIKNNGVMLCSSKLKLSLDKLYREFTVFLSLN